MPCAAATRRATGVAFEPSGSATAAPASVARARRARGLRRGRLGPLGPGPGGDPADDLADRDGLARLGEDLGDGAGRGGGHLGVDLVRGDLDDRGVGLDRVADGLGPLEHDALGDRLAHLRHDDVDQLGLARLGLVGRGRRGRVRRGRGAAVGGRDLGEDGADADGVALGGVQLDDGAGDRGGDLCVDLVGRDLDQRLVCRDRVPLRLVPFQDGALADRVTHRRHDDLNRRRVYRHWNRIRPYRANGCSTVDVPRR